MEELTTGYELSRNFFDWCFENPEKVKPNHIAMYFFIVEHWNRLGQKEKFGLPMEMTKDAIGIKNYKTYASTFNDLVNWNFIKVLQKSKNQYSANVIAIVKNTKATTKALSKASLKHSQKQVQSIVGIDKPITIEPITYNNKDWRKNFGEYLEILNSEYDKILNDSDFFETQQKYYPNIDIKLSLEKSIVNFWGTEAGWKHKKKSRTKEIDWRQTFVNAIPMNKVFKQSQSNGQTFKSTNGTKLSGTQKAIEELVAEVREKSKRFEERMQES